MTDIAALLQADVPREYVTQRSGGGGIKLDYVTGRYCKQRLNEIFGWDGWSYEVVDKQLFPEECTAFVHVRLKIGEVTKDGMAYGHGRKGAEGFDFAIAEAVTDALKRAAVSLGQNMGLSLYPITKGSKVDPHAADHSVADTPAMRAKDPASLVEGFAMRMGECTNAQELGQVAAQMAAAGLDETEKDMLREIYKSTKMRVGG